MYRWKQPPPTKILSIAYRVSDSLTTLNTFVTITSHYFEDWEVKSAMQWTSSMPLRNTSENIANVLQAAVQDCGISNKVGVCVHDNITNVLLAKHTVTNIPTTTTLDIWRRIHTDALRTYWTAVRYQWRLQTEAITIVVRAASRHHSTMATEALKIKTNQICPCIASPNTSRQDGILMFKHWDAY